MLMSEIPEPIILSPTRSLVPSSVPDLDETLLREWLRSKRSPHTRKAYRRDIEAFYQSLASPQRAQPHHTLREVTLTDLQDYAEQLAHTYPEPATQSRKLATIKSLL